MQASGKEMGNGKTEEKAVPGSTLERGRGRAGHDLEPPVIPRQGGVRQ
jgi:hypothetical protein